MVSNTAYYINRFELGDVVWLEFKEAYNDVTHHIDPGTNGTSRYVTYLGHTKDQFHFAAVGIYYRVNDNDILDIRLIRSHNG